MVHVIGALVITAAVWSTLAKVDIVIKGEGRLIAPGKRISMQVYQTAVVKSINVHIGERVKKGQRLASLDATFAIADRRSLQDRVAALTAAKQRIKAEIEGKPYDPPNPNASERAQIRLYQDRQALRKSELASLKSAIMELEPQLKSLRVEEPLLQRQLRLAHEMVSVDQTLASQGLGLKRQLIESKVKVLDDQATIDENKQRRGKLVEQIKAARADRDAYVNKWSRELAKNYENTSNELNAASAKLIKAVRRSELISMRSPVDASVLNIFGHNVGSVLRTGETLMTLVPTSKKLLLDLAVASKDAPYLNVGQKVSVKFEALPYEEYGAAQGTIVALTNDTVGDNRFSSQTDYVNGSGSQGAKSYYRARVAVRRDSLPPLPDGFRFRPGMKASADVDIGKRSVAAYLLYPLTKPFGEALHER